MCQTHPTLVRFRALSRAGCYRSITRSTGKIASIRQIPETKRVPCVACRLYRVWARVRRRIRGCISRLDQWRTISKDRIGGKIKRRKIGEERTGREMGMKRMMDHCRSTEAASFIFFSFTKDFLSSVNNPPEEFDLWYIICIS